MQKRSRAMSGAHHSSSPHIALAGGGPTGAIGAKLLASHGMTAALGTGYDAAHAIRGLLDEQSRAGLTYLTVLEKTDRS